MHQRDKSQEHKREDLLHGTSRNPFAVIASQYNPPKLVAVSQSTDLAQSIKA